MTTGAKLVIGGVLIAAVTAYMAYLGASSSWQYYVTVDECLASGSELAGERIRASGTVSDGSLVVAADRTEATFALEGTRGKLRVVCAGPVPDNLADGMSVVVEGRFDAERDLLEADKVLTRCASKYAAEESSGSPAERPAAAEGGP